MRPNLAWPVQLFEASLSARRFLPLVPIGKFCSGLSIRVTSQSSRSRIGLVP